MTPDSVIQAYRTAVQGGELVTVRRYAGKGAARTVAQEAVAMGRVIGYQPHDIVGAVQQGDRKVILFNDPGAAIPSGNAALLAMLPLTSDDKLVIEGREVAIVGPDDATRRFKNIVIALELQVRG
jgi:hypothetical protein